MGNCNCLPFYLLHDEELNLEFVSPKSNSSNHDNLHLPFGIRAIDGDMLYGWVCEKGEIKGVEKFDSLIIEVRVVTYVRQKDESIAEAIEDLTRVKRYLTSMSSFLNGDIEAKFKIYDTLLFNLVPSNLALVMLDEISQMARLMAEDPWYGPRNQMQVVLHVNVYCLIGDNKNRDLEYFYSDGESDDADEDENEDEDEVEDPYFPLYFKTGDWIEGRHSY